ncbi:MAG: type II toxin-antitoxin system VapC family toxin [Bryobacteraceae bacterium]
MKAIVDTNVVAYHLLGVEQFAGVASVALRAISNPIAPAHWEAELASVVWMAVRTGAFSHDEGQVRLRLARRLGIESASISPLGPGALIRSVQSGVAVYDTLFVELAVRERCPLITFDGGVLRAFPDIAVSPRTLTA